ncbi:MAG: hypothetical protein KAY96_04125, partial [Bacteroidia bacterium]|nr:hypothetical protein [Bacteroidia bacterium]
MKRRHPMIHILVGNENKLKTIAAIKAHLPLMLGEIMECLNLGRPVFSFESFDVDAQMVKGLISELKLAGASIVFQEDIGGMMETISEEEVFAALRLGNEISEQVEREMEREATKVIAIVNSEGNAHFHDFTDRLQANSDLIEFGWDSSLLTFLKLARQFPDSVQLY